MGRLAGKEGKPHWAGLRVTPYLWGNYLPTTSLLTATPALIVPEISSDIR